MTIPAAAAERLAALLGEIERVNKLDGERKSIWAPGIARQALKLAAELCGPELLAYAYGAETEGEDRAAQLELASDRLWTASHFFASVSDPGSPASFPAMAQEAYLIAHGDKPEFFALLQKRQGRKGNASAVSLSQISALEWEAFLEGKGLSAAARQGLIMEAYGATWDAMKKWRAALEETFGEDVVGMRIETARLSGRDALAMGDTDTPRGALADSGLRHKRVMGFNV